MVMTGQKWLISQKTESLAEHPLNDAVLGQINDNREDDASSVNGAFWDLNSIFRFFIEISNETGSLLDTAVFLFLSHAPGTMVAYLNEAQS